MPERLLAVRLPGLRLDSLGNYLAAIGLLRVTTGKWPRIRGLWDDNEFVLAHSGLTRDALRDFLLHEYEPVHYKRWWKGEKETLAASRSWEPDLSRVKMLDAHIVARPDRNVYNDILGTGGNVGKRDFEKVSAACHELISRDNAGGWLDNTLFFRGPVELPDLPSTGTWFANANKAFNSGLSAAKEGRLSPWSYLLALEGALQLRGGAGKRLSGRARPYATFPFISDAAPPEVEGELGTERSEFWAPVWCRPATFGELRALLQRGQARVGHRAAQATFDFAVAALTAGTQAGVTEFARFSLRQTTSANTYEAIRAGTARIEQNTAAHIERSLQQIANWAERLPEDQSTAQKSVFVGLRAPVNKALLGVAQNSDEPERWRELIRAVGEVEWRADRNRNWRSRARGVSLIDERVFVRAWNGALPPEVDIARAIASIEASDYALRNNIFGIERGFPQKFTDSRRSVVWHQGDPVRVLADVLERRLVDEHESTEKNGPRGKAPALASKHFCSPENIDAFVTGRLDFHLVASLIPGFSLIAWSRIKPDEHDQRGRSPEYLLQAFVRPLLTPSPLVLVKNTKPIEPDAIRARCLARMIRSQSWPQVFSIAEGAYRAARIDVLKPDEGIVANGDRIAASLLIPASRRAILTGFRRWIAQKKEGKVK
jgi:CRISPR-associated protein Csx17